MNMAEKEVLDIFNLKTVQDEVIFKQIYGGRQTSDIPERLQCCLSQLPDCISNMMELALRQEKPFLPSDEMITREIMAVNNDNIPSVNYIEVVSRCIAVAMAANNLTTVAALIFVVDRAVYRFGDSRALLRVVDILLERDPQTPVAPQVIIRKARVMKDDGDLHGAIRVLDAVISKELVWDYRDEDQYNNVKAVCVQVKGQILHNLGLWTDAIEHLIESVQGFNKIKDNKGASYSLGLMSKCLKHLTMADFKKMKQKFPTFFCQVNPFYEAYVKGQAAVQYIADMGQTLYSVRHQLEADTSLLKYAVLSPLIFEEYRWLQTIITEMKTSISVHKTINALRSSEHFFEFVRALFMIHLTLAFSPCLQDQCLSEYIQQLSIELYHHLCNHNKNQQVTGTLGHTAMTIDMMNQALTVLGLPILVGRAHEEESVSHQDEVSGQGEDSGVSEPEGGAVPGRNPEQESNVVLADGVENVTNSRSFDKAVPPADSDSQEEMASEKDYNKDVSSCLFPNRRNSRSQQKDSSDSDLTSGIGDTIQTVSSSSLPSDSIGCSQSQSKCSQMTSATNGFSNLRCSQTEPSIISIDTKSTEKYRKMFHRNSEGRTNYELMNDRRGWTYSFGHETRQENGVKHKTQGFYTFPQMTRGKVLDPKKQWQTYKHKCVGLPVDPNFFASPSPSDESLHEFDADVSSSDGEDVESTPLVNLSVPFIEQTVENRTNPKGRASPVEKNGLVDQLATTELSSTSCTESSDRFLLHPHDLPNQPMRSQCNRDKHQFNDDVDVSEFAPLVDLSKTTVTDSLEEMRLGRSISTTDPVEYINNWHPLGQIKDQSCKVQRAFLLTYNPATSDWSAQSTLAFVGLPLDLAKGKKGNCRDLFNVQFLHQDEPRGRYVGKRYMESRARHHHPKRYMQDVICQMMAGYYVIKFNEAMQNYKRDIQVQFLPAAHLQLLTPGGDLEDCFNVEPYLHGDFIKLTNNSSFSNKTEHQGEELATALTHFSYCESKGTLMIVDIQGWLPREGSGVIYLTDPQFHTSGMERFSSFDHQEKGMTKFWESVHPECNDMCRAIGLERPNK